MADDCLFLAARSAFKLGEYEESKELFEKLISNYPETDLIVDAWFGISENLIFLKEYDGSLDVYKNILSNWPNNYLKYEIYLRQGDVLKGIGRVNDAVESYKKATEADYVGTKIQAMFNIASIFEKEGKSEESKEEFLKIVYEYPNERLWRGKAAIRAAEMLLKENKIEDSLKLFKKVASSNSPEKTFALEKIKEIEGQLTK